MEIIEGNIKNYPRSWTILWQSLFYQLFQKENGRILCNFPNGVTTTRTNLTRQEFDRRRVDLELDLATEPMLNEELKKAILNNFLKSLESQLDQN